MLILLISLQFKFGISEKVLNLTLRSLMGCFFYLFLPELLSAKLESLDLMH